MLPPSSGFAQKTTQSLLHFLLFNIKKEDIDSCGECDLSSINEVNWDENRTNVLKFLKNYMLFHLY